MALSGFRVAGRPAQRAPECRGVKVGGAGEEAGEARIDPVDGHLRGIGALQGPALEGDGGRQVCGARGLGPEALDAILALRACACRTLLCTLLCHGFPDHPGHPTALLTTAHTGAAEKTSPGMLRACWIWWLPPGSCDVQNSSMVLRGRSGPG